MDLRRVRQQCEARLHSLVLPIPFDLAVFCASLAAQRGRPLVLLPLHRVTEVTGMWIGLSSRDIIAYSRAMSRLHQEHIIVHELSHMLCGHQPTLSDADVAAFSFLDGEIDLLDVEIGARQHVLYRSGYTSEEEQEVELLASLILDRTQRDQPAMPSSERLEAVLEEGARHSA